MIPALLLYLLKTQLALLGLLGVYYGLLRRLTFHQLNRAYLLAAAGITMVFPVVDLGWLLPNSGAITGPLVEVWPTWAAGPAAVVPAVASGPDYGAWLLGGYWAGVGLLLGRLLMQGASLWRLHQASELAAAAGIRFRAVAAAVSPFSFGCTIYLNPSHHTSAELFTILLHERVHVRQAHTVDVLLAHLLRIGAWWSPAAWLLLRAVQENLEFIADAAVLRESQLPAKEYQYSLVRLSTLAPGPALVTSFSLLTLKNRIRMMNTLPSSPRQLLRYVAGMLVLTGVAVACATPRATEIPHPTSTQQEANLLKNMTFLVDGKEVGYDEQMRLFANDEKTKISSVHVFRGNKASKGVNLDALRQDFGNKLDTGLMFIFTESGLQSERVQTLLARYNITAHTTTPEKRQAMEALYAKLREGKPLTDAEIGGRMIMIDKREATAAELRALPAEVVTGVSVVDEPVPKYGDKARNGILSVLTKASRE